MNRRMPKACGDHVSTSLGPSLKEHKPAFLHGYLDIQVIKAKNLKDMETLVSKFGDTNDVTDAFVDIKLGSCILAKTPTVNNNLNPVWNQTFKLPVCHKAGLLVLDVIHEGKIGTGVDDKQVGAVEISTQKLLNGQYHKKIEGWFPIQKGSKVNGELFLGLEYRSASKVEKSFSVESYFPMRQGCDITLYQDAHCPANMKHLNLVKGPNNTANSPQSCWKDLYYAIKGAKHICCITGWSVWTKLKLFRGEEAKTIFDGTLGELLVMKANEGVIVQVMLWREISSKILKGVKDNNVASGIINFFSNPTGISGSGDSCAASGVLNDIASVIGMMGTHDLETYNYFVNAKYTTSNRVLVELMSRSDSRSNNQHNFSATLNTHHQKSVIVDAPVSSTDKRRRLVAFVGGLDMTDGRYDTPNHDLYTTLTTHHKDDFWNQNLATEPTVGPREPWHDIHCRVEGPAALDVMQNFKDRWRKQAKQDSGKQEALVFNVLRKNNLFEAYPSSDPQSWNVQFFRSITDDSATLLTDPKKKEVLENKKGILVDRSLSAAYIQIIRNAEKFIYIENQYFMGSAYGWDKDNNIKCSHTIPAEITKKITDKIEKGERFTAYILIPMFPEGDPSTAGIQSMLYWQYKTMEMMYKDIGEALRVFKPPPHLGQHPTDWLLFTCLGRREMPGKHLDGLAKPRPGSLSEKFRKSLRFPIYVHSKMMIVDDFYIIVGSANINQRSMAGTRDTEMAVGCWQPKENQSNAGGEVHLFRMSLWAEHLSAVHDVFKSPGDIDCVLKVKEMVDQNWKSYNYEQYKAPKEDSKYRPGHLLMYPMDIQQNGMIKNLPNFTSFPDYPERAKIFGTRSAIFKNVSI